MRQWFKLTLLLAWFAMTVPAMAVQKNGFDLSESLLPAEEILQGGPPMDGIPAIDHPKFVRAAGADYLKSSDVVLGVARNGVAKAYPLAILNWHEVVNDRFGSERIVVTFCPLCGTGMAYKATVNDRPLMFGVSGLLYNSDVLLFDRQTKSLWSQILAKAVNGPLKGTHLEKIVLSHTTWSDWRRRYPGTQVLSTETGFSRDYGRSPYDGYAQSKSVYFPVSGTSTLFHPKEQVIGIEVNGHFKAYPFVALSQLKGPLQDTVGGKKITVRFDAENRTGAVYDEGGVEMPSLIAFWFAWYGFHNDTEVFQPQ